jgi:hypothetical protein
MRSFDREFQKRGVRNDALSSEKPFNPKAAFLAFSCLLLLAYSQCIKKIQSITHPREKKSRNEILDDLETE